MKLFILKNKKAGDKKAFEIIKKQVKTKPNSLIGLAAGKTTDSLYKLISKDVLNYPKAWVKSKIFQIDEKLGKDSRKSFSHELQQELKPLFKILSPENIFLMDGNKNPKLTIKNAKHFLKEKIDFLILGIGPEYDPHIAYNTKGQTNLKSSIRVINLHVVGSPSRGAQIRGITIGIKEILASKKILLLAYTKKKADSLHLAFNGKVDIKNVPASALQLHKNLFIVIDKDAGCKISI